MDLAIHPSLNEPDILGCGHRHGLLVVVKPGVCMATLCLRLRPGVLIEWEDLLASRHCGTGLCIADGLVIIVGIGLLNAFGKSGNDSVVFDSCGTLSIQWPDTKLAGVHSL